MTIHIAWGSPVLIAVAMALLYGVLQWSMFVGLAVMFLFAPVSVRLVMGLTKARMVRQDAAQHTILYGRRNLLRPFARGYLREATAPI